LPQVFAEAPRQYDTILRELAPPGQSPAPAGAR